MQLSKLKRGPQSLEGVWWDFETGERLQSPHDSHLCVLVAERGNPAYRDRLAALSIAKRAEMGKLDDSQWQKAYEGLVTEAIAAATLLDWRNLDDENGDPVPYSADTAAEILANEGHWPFRQFVVDCSGVQSAYLQEAERAIVGN